jgi:hypothetical protein
MDADKPESLKGIGMPFFPYSRPFASIRGSMTMLGNRELTRMHANLKQIRKPFSADSRLPAYLAGRRNSAATPILPNSRNSSIHRFCAAKLEIFSTSVSESRASGQQMLNASE